MLSSQIEIIFYKTYLSGFSWSSATLYIVPLILTSVFVFNPKNHAKMTWISIFTGKSGFAASSTAEDVTKGVDGTGLTAIVTGNFTSNSCLCVCVPVLCFWLMNNWILLRRILIAVCLFAETIFRLTSWSRWTFHLCHYQLFVYIWTILIDVEVTTLIYLIIKIKKSK